MTSINSFIGIGTGRCGTKSLVKIIGACKGWQVKHESYLTDWYKPNMTSMHYLLKFLRKGNTGEVSLNLLPRVPYLRKEIPELKIVHIWRDKEKVVNSFLVNHGRRSRVIKGPEEAARIDARKRNPHGAMHKLAGMPEIFPKFVTEDVEESYRMYWDYYMKKVHQMYNIFHLYAPDLVNDDEVTKLFDYLEIDKKDRVFIDKRVYS